MSALGFRNGLLFSAADPTDVRRMPLMSRGIVGIEFQRPFELGLSSRKIPIMLHLEAAQNSMGMSKSRVQLQCLAGGGVRSGNGFAYGAAVTRQGGIGICQTGIRQRIARVFGNGLIKI